MSVRRYTDLVLGFPLAYQPNNTSDGISVCIDGVLYCDYSGNFDLDEIAEEFDGVQLINTSPMTDDGYWIIGAVIFSRDETDEEHVTVIGDENERIQSAQKKIRELEQSLDRKAKLYIVEYFG